MICPNCDTACPDNSRFCFHCGTPLTAQPRRKQGTHWIPIVIMAVIFLCSLGIYLATVHRPNISSEMPWFMLKDGYLYFNEELYSGSSEITIPSEVAGNTVYHIGSGCFQNCETITTVKLPDTIQSIESSAFSGCKKLRGILIPDSVTTIGQNAFRNCRELEAICIPDSVVSIGTNSFDGCDQLLFVFFLGNYAQWTELYDEFINFYTGIYCEDGNYMHGGSPD